MGVRAGPQRRLLLFLLLGSCVSRVRLSVTPWAVAHRLLVSWGSPGKNTEVGCYFLLQKKTEHWRIDAFELWCWRILLRALWTAKRSNESILKDINQWMFIGRTEAEAPILWPPDTKSQLTGKDPEAGKEWRQKEKGAAEDEIVR